MYKNTWPYDNKSLKVLANKGKGIRHSSEGTS